LGQGLDALVRRNALPKKENLNNDDSPRNTFMAEPESNLVR
jgi:hypothetical protein